MRVFGYRHLGRLFQRVFMVDDEGDLWRKGTHIPWRTLVAYRRADTLFGVLSRQPHTRFFLDDGRSFVVYTWLEEAGRVPRRVPGGLSGLTDAYEEFIQLLQARSSVRDLQSTPARRYTGLWVIAIIAGQGLAGAGYTFGLASQLPLEVVLMAAGGMSGLVGWLVQRHLQRRHIRRLRKPMSQG